MKGRRIGVIMGVVTTPGAPPWNPEERPFSISEVAKLFGVTVQAVHLWIKSGRLRKRTRTSERGTYQIPRSEVVRLLEAAGREVPGLWERRFAKVLVIDDDPGIRKLVLAAGRRPAFPMTVEAASSVEDGIVLAARFQPDVILLDAAFSKDLLSGLEGLAFIRHATLIRKSKVIALVDHSRTAARFLKAGAEGVLQKPFGLSDLRSAIYRALKSSVPSAARSIECGSARPPSPRDSESARLH